MHANKREEIKEVCAGDIAAAVGLKYTHHRRHALRSKTTPIVLESMDFPEPVIAVAIEPKTKADQEKLGIALAKLARRRTRPSASTRTRRPARPSSPAWASCTSRSSSTACCASSRSTPTSASRRSPTARPSPRRSKAKGSSSASPADGPVRPRLAADRAAGTRARVTSSSTTSRAAWFPREFIPAVDKGIKEALERGVVAGYPMVDVKVTLFDGSYHDVDSSRNGVQDRRLDGASRKAARRRSPILLEPIMDVEVVTPEDYMGDVIGDLNSRRGQIRAWKSAQAPGHRGAMVPLAEMFGYCHATCARMTPGARDLHHAVRRTTSRCRRRWPRKSSQRLTASAY